MRQAEGTSLHLREGGDREQDRRCYLLLRYVLSLSSRISQCPQHPGFSPRHIIALPGAPLYLCLMLIWTSTGQRAAGACTCNRSGEENTVTGDKCACGKRSSSMSRVLFSP